jgi:hypothetical protein
MRNITARGLQATARGVSQSVTDDFMCSDERRNLLRPIHVRWKETYQDLITDRRRIFQSCMI